MIDYGGDPMEMTANRGLVLSGHHITRETIIHCRVMGVIRQHIFLFFYLLNNSTADVYFAEIKKIKTRFS